MKRLPILNAVLLSAALSACGGGGSPGPTPGGSTVASIELGVAAASVAVGQTTTLAATARDAQGQVVPGATFTWKSSPETVATVAAGVVTGVKAGSAQVTASVGGVTSAPATVTVTAPTPAAGYDLSVSATKLPVITGTSATLTVSVARQSGFTDAVTVTLGGLPTGTGAPSVTIPAGQTSATVTVSAAANAPHSQPTAVTVKGSAGAQSVTKTVTVTVRGPAGSVDTTFGAGGISVTSMSAGDDYANALAVQPDGKLLTAGRAFGAGDDFAVVRYTRDGALDPTFGSGGKVLIDFGGKSDTARALAVQPDGRIVVAGNATDSANEEHFALARLDADGRLDAGFGTGGRITTAIPGSGGDRVNALLVQPDGRIVAGGQASFSSATTGVDFAVARYTATGALDGSFGSGGVVTTPVNASGASDKIFGLALMGDKLLAVGGDVFQAVRYTASGALDASFGAGGKVSALFSGSGSAAAVQIDAQGRAVIVGEHQLDTAAVRLTASGSLDGTFGTGGRTELPLSAGNWDKATAVAVQSDGKVVLGGWVYEGASSNGNFAVTRLTAAGQPDAGFGANGTTITPVAPNGKGDEATAAVLQPDDRIPATRIVLAGQRNDSNTDFALTRYWP